MDLFLGNARPGGTRVKREAWTKNARFEKTREKAPRLWKVVLSFVITENFAQLFLLQIFILCERILQPTMFATVFTSGPFLPWYWAAIAGYWLSVFVEGLVRSHYSYSAKMTSASVKSGLTGLVFNKVILIHIRFCL